MCSTYESINGKPMTEQQIKLYMDRLETERPEKPDLKSLTELQRAHICHIPFENLDIIEGIPISLDREALFEKIIIRKRGGVCSELNTLYNWLLESVGYSPVSYMSRIIAKTAPVQHKSHRIMAVCINGEKYITDVGFNYEHHRIPVKLEEGIVQDDGECRYRFTRDDVFGWILWQDRPAMGWRKKISFTEDPCIDIDLIPATFYAENHKNSAINKFAKVSLHIDGTFYAIRSGQFLKETGGVEHLIERLDSKDREDEILREVFSLTNEISGYTEDIQKEK